MVQVSVQDIFLCEGMGWIIYMSVDQNLGPLTTMC